MTGSANAPAPRWRWRSLLAWGGLAAVASWGLYAVATPRPPPPPPKAVAPPSPRPVAALGRLQPMGDSIRLSAPTNAGQGPRILRLRVQEGDFVERGHVVAELDTLARLDADLAVAEADVATKHALAIRARAQWRADVTARRAAVAKAEADYALKDVEFNRATALARTQAGSQQALDRATLERELAARSLEEARSHLTRVETTDGDLPVDVAIAEREHAMAAAGAARARAAREDGLIRAPADGQVLAVHTREGERIGSDGLLEMGATETMEAVVEVYESDIGRVSIGQMARVYAPSLAVPLVGRVTRVGLIVKRQTVVNSDPTSNTDARVIEVRITLNPESSRRSATLTRLQVRATIRSNSLSSLRP